ncbi:MAG: hypothetical protein ACI4QT_08445 [Kiritimatiellia bacterium]
MRPKKKQKSLCGFPFQFLSLCVPIHPAQTFFVFLCGKNRAAKIIGRRAFRPFVFQYNPLKSSLCSFVVKIQNSLSAHSPTRSLSRTIFFDHSMHPYPGKIRDK